MVVVACSLLAGALLAVAAAPDLVLKTLYRGDGAAVGVALLPILLGSLLRANMPDAPACFEEVFEANRRQSQDTLDGQAEKLEMLGVSVTQKRLRVGRPEEEIVVVAEKIGVDLVALGGRGLGGVRRVLLGSVSDSVLRHTHCPVLLVRGE